MQLLTNEMADPRLQIAKAKARSSSSDVTALDVVTGHATLADYLGLDAVERRDLLERACAYLEAGHFQPASEIVELLLALGEEHPTLLFLVARCLLARGNLQAAIDAAAAGVAKARSEGWVDLAEGGARWLARLESTPT